MIKPPCGRKTFEDSFSDKKTGAVFVDLTAAYHTVWHRSLTCKLLRLLTDRNMICVIMKLVGNRIFNLTTGNNKRSQTWTTRIFQHFLVRLDLNQSWSVSQN